ncbi:MAG: peptidylprolyl isomerase [Crocosphaera sp.]|nr:peptidylprolyl isomerase [Crocosphaera sp.]
MPSGINIADQDILKQIKLSGKVPEIIDEIIKHRIITKEGEKLDIIIETEELQTEADQFRLVNELHSANDTHQWLEKNRLSLDDFEEMLCFTILSRKLANHLFSDKIGPYFYQNQLDYTEAIIYEIILDDEDLGMELYYAIDEEEMSFWDVAHQYIQNEELRRKGGYLGPIKRQSLKPEISAAVFAANPPQLLKPILTSQGVHLILVETIIEPELNEKKRYQILDNLFSEWLNNQVKYYLSNGV